MAEIPVHLDKLKHASELRERAYVGQIAKIDYSPPHEFMKDGRTIQAGDRLDIWWKPLDHQIGGKTGCYHQFVGLTDSKKSVMGALVEAMEKAMGQHYPPAWSGLVGQIFRVERVDIQFGDDVKSEDVHVPYEWLPNGYTPEAAAAARAPAGVAPGGGVWTGSPVAPPAAPVAPATLTITPAVAVAAPPASVDPRFADLERRLVDGMTGSQIERWAQRNGVTLVDLNRHMGLLDQAGRLAKADDGSIVLKA